MYVRETSPHFGSGLTDLLYPDLLRAVALTRLMLARWLEPPDIDRLHLSTLVHQTLSCLKQTGGLPAAQLHQTLCKEGPFRHVTPAMFKLLLAASLASYPDGESGPISSDVAPGVRS
jgi:ATP-dependent Lhr-like helicase